MNKNVNLIVISDFVLIYQLIRYLNILLLEINLNFSSMLKGKMIDLHTLLMIKVHFSLGQRPSKAL